MQVLDLKKRGKADLGISRTVSYIPAMFLRIHQRSVASPMAIMKYLFVKTL